MEPVNHTSQILMHLKRRQKQAITNFTIRGHGLFLDFERSADKSLSVLCALDIRIECTEREYTLAPSHTNYILSVRVRMAKVRRRGKSGGVTTKYVLCIQQ